MSGNPKFHHRKGLKTQLQRERALRMEALEERTLLSVSPVEYEALCAQYSDLNLPQDSSDLNIIEITAEQLSLAALKDAIATAGTTTQSDLIVVRTTEDVNTITYTASTDELNININASQYGSVTIVSLGETNLTLDANQMCRVMTVAGSTKANLGGLTIQNGKAGRGGGIYVNSGNLLVTNSEISFNTATATGAEDGGGGIHVISGTLTVTSSKISGNTSYSGGGIWNNGSATVISSIITNNKATYSGGGIRNSRGTATIINSEISNNTASSYGGGIYNGYYNSAYTFNVINCTIAGNTANSGGGIYRYTGTVNVTNSIIATNNAGSGKDVSGSLNGSNNLSSYTAWNGSDNIAYDPDSPLFYNIGKGDYRLAPGSQAIDMGNNQYAYNAGMDETWTDILGNPRFVGDIIDLGAYESFDFRISQRGIYVGDVLLSWMQYENTANVRLTWVSGTNKTVLGTFDSVGEYTWDTTAFADGYGQLTVEYLDENGTTILSSAITGLILNECRCSPWQYYRLRNVGGRQGASGFGTCQPQKRQSDDRKLGSREILEKRVPVLVFWFHPDRAG